MTLLLKNYRDRKRKSWKEVLREFLTRRTPVPKPEERTSRDKYNQAVDEMINSELLAWCEED